jgi:hypothetical protein
VGTGEEGFGEDGTDVPATWDAEAVEPGEDAGTAGAMATTESFPFPLGVGVPSATRNETEPASLPKSTALWNAATAAAKQATIAKAAASRRRTAARGRPGGGSGRRARAPDPPPMESSDMVLLTRRV